MAIYHLSVKPISRGSGRTATAASAYRSATRVRDDATGEVFDYTRKRGVEHTEILLPAAQDGSAAWARDRQQLWNAAEAAERRKDARVAREYEVALPHELTPAERLALVREFARELAERYRVSVDVAIHAPHKKGDDRNHHAHILTTTREVTPDGLGPKSTIELKDPDRAKRGLPPARVEVVEIRERWAALVNEHLSQRGHETRVDHRTLEAQGIYDRSPQVHLGPVVNDLRRQGKQSDVLDRIRSEEREEATRRLTTAAERGQLERETTGLTRSTLDLETTLDRALAARRAAPAVELNVDRTPPESPDIKRQSAQDRWLASRTEEATPKTSTTPERTLILDTRLDRGGRDR